MSKSDIAKAQAHLEQALKDVTAATVKLEEVRQGDVEELSVAELKQLTQVYENLGSVVMRVGPIIPWRIGPIPPWKDIESPEASIPLDDGE
jgi:hypothetical protein